jgi:hypothetical protein
LVALAAAEHPRGVVDDDVGERVGGPTDRKRERAAEWRQAEFYTVWRVSGIIRVAPRMMPGSGT